MNFVEVCGARLTVDEASELFLVGRTQLVLALNKHTNLTSALASIPRGFKDGRVDEMYNCLKRSAQRLGYNLEELLDVVEPANDQPADDRVIQRVDFLDPNHVRERPEGIKRAMVLDRSPLIWSGARETALLLWELRHTSQAIAMGLYLAWRRDIAVHHQSAEHDEVRVSGVPRVFVAKYSRIPDWHLRTRALPIWLDRETMVPRTSFTTDSNYTEFLRTLEALRGYKVRAVYEFPHELMFTRGTEQKERTDGQSSG